MQDIANRAAQSKDNVLLQSLPPSTWPEELSIDTGQKAIVLSNSTLEKRFDYEPDDLGNPERVARKLQNLASFGGFSEVDLSINTNQVELRVDERPLGRNLLQASVQASNNFNGDSTYGLLARYSRRPVSSRGGELSVSVEFGTDLGPVSYTHLTLPTICSV